MSSGGIGTDMGAGIAGMAAFTSGTGNGGGAGGACSGAAWICGASGSLSFVLLNGHLKRLSGLAPSDFGRLTGVSR